LGNYAEYSEEHKRDLFLEVPLDRVTRYSDEAIDLLSDWLRKAPLVKELSDKRAEAGLHVVDSQAILADMNSRNLQRSIPLFRLALEHQRSARSRVLEKFKRELEPIVLELEPDTIGPGVPKNTPEQNSKILYELENNLRKCIVTGLRKVWGTEWWKKGVSDDIRQNADVRRKNRSLPAHYPKKAYSEIYYIDFADYKKIILRSGNWNKIFSKKDFFLTDNYVLRLKPPAIKKLLEQLRLHLNSRVRYKGKNHSWDTILQLKTQELARHLLGRTEGLDFTEPVLESEASPDELRKKVLALTVPEARGIGVNKSTLWYLQKRAAARKTLRSYAKVKSKLRFQSI